MEPLRSLLLVLALATILAPPAAAAGLDVDLPAWGQPQAQCHPKPFGICVPHPPIHPADALAFLIELCPC